MKWSSVFRWIQEEYNRSLAVLERSIICDLYMFIAVRLVTWVHLCCKTRTVSLPSINFRVYGYELFTQTIWIWKPWERVNLISTTLVKESLSEFKKQSLYVKNIQMYHSLGNLELFLNQAIAIFRPLELSRSVCIVKKKFCCRFM